MDFTLLKEVVETLIGSVKASTSSPYVQISFGCNLAVFLKVELDAHDPLEGMFLFIFISKILGELGAFFL